MYVNTVEELGRSAAEPCNNSFRRFLSIRQLIHYLQQPSEPVTEYHHVLAYAYQLRQRRFWGVLFCAARLIAKARAVHFVPGIGSAYKSAAAEFSLLRKTV